MESQWNRSKAWGPNWTANGKLRRRKPMGNRGNMNTKAKPMKDQTDQQKIKTHFSKLKNRKFQKSWKQICTQMKNNEIYENQATCSKLQNFTTCVYAKERSTFKTLQIAGKTTLPRKRENNQNKHLSSPYKYSMWINMHICCIQIVSNNFYWHPHRALVILSQRFATLTMELSQVTAPAKL